MPVTIKRSGKTNQFIVEMHDDLDTIRCAVHIEGGAGKPDADLERLAWAKAAHLAHSLEEAMRLETAGAAPVDWVAMREAWSQR